MELLLSSSVRGSQPLAVVRLELRRNIDWKEFTGNLFSFPCLCVGYELSSRAVSSQVFSPLQRLTSVFGMGTGGPTALI